MSKSISVLSLATPRSTRHNSSYFPSQKKKSPKTKKKIREINSKISELLYHKKKVLKFIQQVEIKLKKTYVREAELVKTSTLVEHRIQSLEHKKFFDLRSEVVSSNMKLIIKLRRYLAQFKEIERDESELEKLEIELVVKEQDSSFDTRSTETHLSSSKRSSQMQILKNKLAKVEMQSESIYSNTNFSKMRKDFLYSKKYKLDSEIRSFSMENEIFMIKSSKALVLKQSVLRKKKKIKLQRNQIKELMTDFGRFTKENEEFKQELEDLQTKYSIKGPKRCLEKNFVQVTAHLEKISIFAESIKRKEKMLQIHKEKISAIEKTLWNKQLSIRAKIELIEILANIDKLINTPDTIPQKSSKKQALQSLITQALQKEKQIFALDPLTH